MGNFVAWLDRGAFTPYGCAYDIGRGTLRAITSCKHRSNPRQCGGRSETNNGNGSLMRIMPACLYCCVKGPDDEAALREIHAVGSLTHAHIRSNIACGLYYFMARSVMEEEGTPAERLQRALDRGFAFYEKALADHENPEYYLRLRDLGLFAQAKAEKNRSSVYVIDTPEAAVWSMITSHSFEETLLKAVNLGDDSDTVGAVSGGLAGLYYGFGAIPADWLEAVKKREWIETLCEKANLVTFRE